MDDIFFYTWLGIWIVIMTGVFTINACAPCRAYERNLGKRPKFVISLLSLASLGWILYFVIWAVGTARILGATPDGYATEQLNVATNPTYVYYSYATLTVSLIVGVWLFFEVRINPGYAGPPAFMNYAKDQYEELDTNRKFFITPILWLYLIAQTGINLYLTLQTDTSTGMGPQAFDIISATAQCAFIVLASIITFLPKQYTPYVGVNKITKKEGTLVLHEHAVPTCSKVTASDVTDEDEPAVITEDDVSSMVEATRFNFKWYMAWGCIQATVGLKFFIDTPRFGAYVVMTILLPLIFADRLQRFALWLHYMILASASFWIAFYFFPAVSTISYNFGTYPGAFILTTWSAKTTGDIYGALYIGSLLALLNTVLTPIVGTLGTFRPLREQRVASFMGTETSTRGIEAPLLFQKGGKKW